jgi:predicted RNase H-like HicB family nuclease
MYIAYMNTYTAVTKKDGNWWIGWIEEVPGVNCQETTREKLIESLKVTLREALEFNRQDAITAAVSGYTEELVTVLFGKYVKILAFLSLANSSINLIQILRSGDHVFILCGSFSNQRRAAYACPGGNSSLLFNRKSSTNSIQQCERTRRCCDHRSTLYAGQDGN